MYYKNIICTIVKCTNWIGIKEVHIITYYYQYLFYDLANFVNSVLKLKISLLKDIIIRKYEILN